MKVPRVGNHPLDTRCIHEVLEHGNGGIRHACLIERTPHIGIGTYHAHFERTLVARLPKLGRGNARTALRQVNVSRHLLSSAVGRVVDLAVEHREHFTRFGRTSRQCVQRCRAKVERVVGFENRVPPRLPKPAVQHPNGDLGAFQEHELYLGHRDRVLKGEWPSTCRCYQRGSRLQLRPNVPDLAMEESVRRQDVSRAKATVLVAAGSQFAQDAFRRIDVSQGVLERRPVTGRSGAGRSVISPDGRVTSGGDLIDVSLRPCHRQ